MPKFIALAEDDADDQLLFTEALKQVSDGDTLTTVSNGMMMLDLLQRSKNSLPDVIVLDVNMPGMDGIECLKAIRSTPDFNHLPVIIMSTSTNPETVEDAYTHGASRYAVKPGKFDELKRIVEKITGFDWRPIKVRNRNNFILKPTTRMQ